MESEAIFKSKEIITGSVSLKTAPRVIVIKARKLTQTVKALNIAIEYGYTIKASYYVRGLGGGIRVFLERED